MSAVAEATNVETTPMRSADYCSAKVLACILCGLFTLVGLLVPPSLSHDAGWGMQEWRTLAGGGPINTIIGPDPTDISRDEATHITWWSPGQYLVPGILTLFGLRLGSAVAITVGASLLCCLFGWIQVAEYFGLGPRVAMLVVAFMATFRYSTLPFGSYNGGEILLQGITPWLILIGCRIPSMSGLRAAGLASLAIWIAFFVKLTGVIVVSAALFMGAVEVMARLKRITAGMVGGAIGAILAFGLLYVSWFSLGATPASGAGWSFRFGDFFFALAAPWGAGMSWGDMLAAILRRSALENSGEGSLPAIIIWLLLPPVLLFVTVILKGWRDYAADANLRRLLTITLGFYAICALTISAIWLHGGDVSLEERHLRAAGMLIFVCVLAVAGRLPRHSVIRLAVGALCCFMTVYGCFAFGLGAWSTKRGEIDHYSRTRQASDGESAIEFVRAAFERDGRDALFVLPSPDAASAFLPNVRTVSNNIEFESEATISTRTYRGKVRGPLYVVVPEGIEQSVSTLLLKEFVDYPLDGWEKRSFGSSTVFVQERTDALN